MSATEIAEPLGSVAGTGRAESPRFLRRLLGRRIAIVCIVYLILLVVVAVVAPIALPGVAEEHAGDLYNVLDGPSWAHPLGTDSAGRDVLDRLLVGTRVTMLGVAYALVVALVIGIPLGLAAGYFGGRTDRAVSSVAEMGMAIPGIAIVLVVLSVFPKSMPAGMAAVGCLIVPSVVRIVRSATLPIREELYIAAARVSGVSRPAIMGRHVLSRIAGAVIILGSLVAAGALLAQTGLAYLGLIVTIPEPSWGGMVGDGIQNISSQPWLIWPPGIVMTLTIVALGLLADSVRDATAEGWSAAGVRRRRRSTAATALEVPPSALPAAENLTVSLASPALASRAAALLSVERITVTFPSPAGPVMVVDDVSFDIGPGETLGLVGESGCGKTVTAMSLLGLIPGNGEIAAGRIVFDGQNLVSLSEAQLERVRGKEIGLISQEPMVSFNPTFRVGGQVAMCVRTHHNVSRRAAKARAIELLRSVHLPEPELVARRYPHELSGGMAQRVAIARALAGEPKLLIADEPTTALDVTVQAEILDLLRELQNERGMAILLVAHDWGVVADLCDRAVVMYAGQVVERAALEPLFHDPLHPYTEALLASNPHHALDAVELATIPGTVPRPGAWPAGCHFHPRCNYATEACKIQPIQLEHPLANRETRCIHHDQLLLSPR